MTRGLKCRCQLRNVSAPLDALSRFRLRVGVEDHRSRGNSWCEFWLPQGLWHANNHVLSGFHQDDIVRWTFTCSFRLDDTFWGRNDVSS